MDMSMQVLAFNSRVVHLATVRTEIMRRLTEVVGLITRGVAIEESHRGFCVGKASMDDLKCITPGALLFHAPTFYLSF